MYETRTFRRDIGLAALAVAMCIGGAFAADLMPESPAIDAKPVIEQTGEWSVVPQHVFDVITTAPDPEPYFPAVPGPDARDVERLAIAIYREGGGDAMCDECRYRIGDVVLNRVADDRFPSTIQEVLTQKGQYGTMHWDGIVWPARAKYDVETNAVERAKQTAADLLADTRHSELYGKGYIFQSEFSDLGHDAVKHCGMYYAKG